MNRVLRALNKRLLLAAVSPCRPTCDRARNRHRCDTRRELEEIIVTGSRIAAPNEVSTSPIVVISSKSIETTGKTDISDLIMQLPQNFNNALGQDFGKHAAA